MYSVRVDHRRNRLYFMIRGHLHDDETLEAAQCLFGAARALREGFVVVEDQSEFRPVTPLGDRIIGTAHRMVARLGAGQLVRVPRRGSTVPAWQPGCRTDVMTSLDDAERTLAN